MSSGSIAACASQSLTSSINIFSSGTGGQPPNGSVVVVWRRPRRGSATGTINNNAIGTSGVTQSGGFDSILADVVKPGFHMRSDLVPLTSDLPATAAVGVATQSAGIRGVGDVKRSGPWSVPAENTFRTWFGHIKLDLRQAQIGAAETHIHARALFGNIDLLVPEGVEVEVQARTQVGRTSLQASSGIGGAPRIVVTGGTFFGDIKVRHRRLWEKMARRGRLTE